MTKKVLAVIVILVVVVIGSVTLFALDPGDHSCNEFNLCPADTFGCEASSWHGYPECWLKCKVEGEYHCANPVGK